MFYCIGIRKTCFYIGKICHFGDCNNQKKVSVQSDYDIFRKLALNDSVTELQNEVSFSTFLH